MPYFTLRKSMAVAYAVTELAEVVEATNKKSEETSKFRMTDSLSDGIPPPRLQTLASLGLDPPLLSRRGVLYGPHKIV
jgi:hypothetical protein